MKRQPVHYVILVVALAMNATFARAQDPREAALKSVHEECLASGGRPSVDTLVRLDQKLRALIPHWTWEGRGLSISGDPGSYSDIGVEPLAFERDFVGYSGSLLQAAHELDPQSRRPFTLYATVFGAEGEMGNTPPSPDAAAKYLKEFPTGPFALQAHLALATFQTDLFQVIQDKESGEPEDYKYECYRSFVTTTALPAQRRQAQASAVEHYLALVRLRPDVHEFADWLANARRGRIEGWHYCAD